jgi:hypothetical protein
MYQKHHNGQLSIEEFHLPFGGKLDPHNRWVFFASLMPWGELEETYAPQFSPRTGAPAKSVRIAFGALFIKQRCSATMKLAGALPQYSVTSFNCLLVTLGSVRPAPCPQS